MDHVSRPLLIALVAAIVFAGAWLAVLRPEPTEGEGGPAPAAVQNQGLDSSVPSAAGAAPATPPAAPSAPGASAARPASARPAPAPAPSDRSAPILRALDRGKVAVLLFWSPRAADDRAVRRAVAAVDRRDGRVTVRSSRVGRVGDYDAITQGVEVLQSPTVLVIGPDRRARTIVGYTDTKAIDQLVGDVGRGKTAPSRRIAR